MNKDHNAHTDDHGFTIVELLVSTAIAAIISVTMLTLGLYFFGNVMQSQATAQMALDSQLILTQLVEDIRLSDGISATNQLTDVNAPPGGWVTNDPSNIIIIETPAVDSSRSIIFDTSTGYPYRNEQIYFASGTALHKRTLKNSNAIGNTATTTCPEASASPSCPADKKYTDYMNNLTFTFYDVNNVQTTDPALARSVNLTVNMSRRVYGKTITLSNSTRTTLRNY
jgi:prepilin-type N-terminal cleavage/methylation domain-containing protein